jgi:flagellar protein FlaF
MPTNPLDAYQSVERATLSGRELEASVLMRAAQMLQEVRDSWQAPGLEDKLYQVLKHNQRIWTLFQSEWLQEDNPLPTELRENLLSLSAFVDKRTFEILSFPEPSKLEILISINQNLAAGLRGNGSAE